MALESLLEKRRFLVATHSAPVRTQIERLIISKISNVQVFFASDGADALSKMKNLPPHVFICDQDLQKLSGFKVAEIVFQEAALKETALIMLGPIPDTETFVDRVVTGQVQFLEIASDDVVKAVALTRAMNFVARSYVKEFNLRFLAPGEMLIHGGDQGESVFIVRRGRLSAWKSGTRKADLISVGVPLGYIEKGEFVGEMAYISGEKRSADVWAEEECELIEIPVDLLDSFLFQKPSWAKALMVTLSKRIKNANQRQVG